MSDEKPSAAKMKLAVERKSERMDTAYSPRVHEEDPSATAYILLARLAGGAKF